MEQNLVICKTCGYIMEASKVSDVCPACGLPARVFAPYTSKINPKRNKLLELHIHPIVLHFPQALIVLVLPLLVMIGLTSGKLHDDLVVITKFNFLLLPLTILAGFASGLFDGKIRFKSPLRPILKFKIALSAVFFVSATTGTALIFAFEPAGIMLAVLFGLAAVATGSAVILGKTGASLMNAVFPN